MVSKPARPWRDEGGILYFSVTSNGTTGEEWVERLQKKGFRLGDYAKRALLSPGFKPTFGITIEVAVLHGLIFEDDNRLTQKIRTFAAERKLEAPSAEIACLIREKFTDKEIKEMGLWYIVAMHEPFGFDGDMFLLDANRDDGGRWLGTSYGWSDDSWEWDSGFAFVVSQTSS
ncbi:MAG: hypothetical protein WBL19_02090 [Minisyncoccia bacterium]